MPRSGSQCWLCDLPIRYDTYEGCTHDCKYCFVRRKSGLQVKMGESAKGLNNFINGQRNSETCYIDWNIPIHWGGMSDPFQPCERQFRRSLEALKVFAETGYPVVISTKGKICIEEPYISLIGKCNVVMQVSALCSKYDSIEKGAPTFEERLQVINKLSKAAKRVIVRCQPYIHDIFDDVYSNIIKFSQAGAYGVIFEGMKFIQKKQGLVKRGGDWVQPKEILQSDFSRFKQECHKNGLKFYSGENCLRSMGDSLTCCGIDGLDGFIPNRFNLNHIINGDIAEPTETQRKIGTAGCFKAIYQTTSMSHFIAENSFATMQKYIYDNSREYVESVLIGEEKK